MDLSLMAIRTLERIFDLIIGGWTIYLGYLLFSKIPEQKDSSGKITLPGGTMIYMTKIGPGVFFALFGIFVVSFSIFSTYNEESTIIKTKSDKEDKQIIKKSYNFFSSGMSEIEVDTNRLKVLNTIYDFNEIDSQLQYNKIPIEDNLKNIDIHSSIQYAKLYMMLYIWDNKDWGDAEKFQKWVDGGQKITDDFELQNAISIFKNKRRN